MKAIMAHIANETRVRSNGMNNTLQQINNTRALTLIWQHSIEKSFGYQNSSWRDSLKPEEREFVEQLDSIITENNSL